MKVKGKFIYEQLDKLFEEARTIRVSNSDKIVIFSDLHMGDGSSNDDFKTNADMFSFVLENYYLKNNYQLILNGDVEELQRFSMKKIYKAWDKVVDLFSEFGDNLYKTIGNHDLKLSVLKSDQLKHPVDESLKLVFEF